MQHDERVGRIRHIELLCAPRRMPDDAAMRHQMPVRIVRPYARRDIADAGESDLPARRRLAQRHPRNADRRAARRAQRLVDKLHDAFERRVPVRAEHARRLYCGDVRERPVAETVRDEHGECIVAGATGPCIAAYGFRVKRQIHDAVAHARIVR